MNVLFAVLSALIVIIASIPYIIDIFTGRAQPARSTRIMYMLLVILGLLQSKELGSGWSLALIYGEIAQGAAVFFMSLKYGLGGFSRLDKICYIFLTLDLSVWLLTKNPLIGILLTLFADLIATLPTIVKTIKIPESETPIYWFLGSIAAIFAIFSETNYSLIKIIFPIYIFVINAFVFSLTLKRSKRNILSH